MGHQPWKEVVMASSPVRKRVCAWWVDCWVTGATIEGRDRWMCPNAVKLLYVWLHHTCRDRHNVKSVSLVYYYYDSFHFIWVSIEWAGRTQTWANPPGKLRLLRVTNRAKIVTNNSVKSMNILSFLAKPSVAVMRSLSQKKVRSLFFSGQILKHATFYVKWPKFSVENHGSSSYLSFWSITRWAKKAWTVCCTGIDKEWNFFKSTVISWWYFYHSMVHTKLQQTVICMGDHV